MTLRDGKAGMVLKVKHVADSDLKQRLMAMGIIPGTQIKVLRSAPFGDPMAVRIRSYNLALRREDATMVEVQKIS